MKSWKNGFKQSPNTLSLKSLNKQFFQNTASEFEKTLDVDIQFVWDLTGQDQADLYFTSSQGVFDLNTRFYDKPKKLYDSYCQRYIITPTVVIYHLYVYPQRQGLGTKVIHTFIDTLSHTPFKVIFLRALNRDLTTFWQRFGFQTYRLTEGMPGMKLVL